MELDQLEDWVLNEFCPAFLGGAVACLIAVGIVCVVWWLL